MRDELIQSAVDRLIDYVWQGAETESQEIAAKTMVDGDVESLGSEIKLEIIEKVRDLL